MKKVLILAYDFPPYVSVAGLRPKSWYDELLQHDIFPIIVTRQWANKHKGPLDYVEASVSEETIIEKQKKGTIIRTPYTPNLSNRLLLKYGENKFKLLRKGITAYYELLQYFLPIGPKSQVFHAAQDYLSKNDVDVIVATGEPFVLFNYARKLSSKFNVPWVADYRDVWSGIMEKQNKPLIQKFHELQEKRIVPSAAAITTVSSFVRKKIHEITHHDNIHIFPNGFDSNSMEKANLVHQKTDILRIGMAGSILAWNPTEPFFKAVRDFQKKYPEKIVEFHFYGLNIQRQFEDYINKKIPEIKDLIIIHPKTPNTELHLKLSELNALLLFNNFSFMGTKIYDYLGLKRKILFCFSQDKEGISIKNKFYPMLDLDSESDSLQQDLIEKTNSGIIVKNQSHFVEVLSTLSDELMQKGALNCDSLNVNDYSRKIQVEKFAELLIKIGSS